ncbi:two-component sensor histidine kinase [Desulfosarcina alkanivorans]|uniref:histidine kinase n=1 Tax=Desulfosarcina alkanivorans TaxID=571177 RepID=A0A5K7YUC2_9BACT|nr:ATP-binding protein [Desulfosarcina alkanivorans]BBO71643.1 two-component sensor histidine kinase [Desulfosarcina alkanivorans]
MLNLSRLKPRFWDYQDAAAGPGSAHFSFRRKWLMIVAFTTMVTLAPLLVMTLVDYRLTRQAFESEATMGISSMVSNTWRSTSFLLSQRRAALQFVARDNRLSDLLAPGRLAAVLENLQGGLGGFVDLDVMDAQCTLRAHAGPHALEKFPEKTAVCYDGAVANGFFISEVTLPRGQQHQLVVAIRHDQAPGSFFVLRATLDAGLLDEPIARLDLPPEIDAFIVNADGILQTSSRHYGNRFEKISLEVPEPLAGTRVLKTRDRDGRSVLLGVALIPDSPFSLMMVRPESGIMDLWFKPRLRLIGFLLFSIALILASILGVATYLVNRIHVADQRRVQALHQAAYANKLASIGRLASGVAHEVNNPLAIINQKTGLIKDLFTINRDYAGNEKLLGLVDDVLDSVRRCGTITRRLLDFSRHMESSIEAVDIEAIVRQVLAFMEKEAERRCIAVSVSVTDTIPGMKSDRGNLQQIFLNLVNNAFAFMGDGGRLDITIGRHGTAHVRVTVADTGRGIPEGDLKHIFEPFFSTRHDHGGAGLGLSVTYGMVSEMGGHITVISRVNQGTCFTVTLPLNPPRETPAAACAIHPAGHAGADGRSIQRETT